MKCSNKQCSSDAEYYPILKIPTADHTGVHSLYMYKKALCGPCSLVMTFNDYKDVVYTDEIEYLVAMINRGMDLKTAKVVFVRLGEKPPF